MYSRIGYLRCVAILYSSRLCCKVVKVLAREVEACRNPLFIKALLQEDINYPDLGGNWSVAILYSSSLCCKLKYNMDTDDRGVVAILYSSRLCCKRHLCHAH